MRREPAGGSIKPGCKLQGPLTSETREPAERATAIVGSSTAVHSKHKMNRSSRVTYEAEMDPGLSTYFDRDVRLSPLRRLEWVASMMTIASSRLILPARALSQTCFHSQTSATISQHNDERQNETNTFVDGVSRGSCYGRHCRSRR